MSSVTIRKNGEIDTGQGPLEDPELVVGLERLRHLARACGQIAGEIVGRDDDAGRLPVLRLDHRGRIQQIAGASQCLDGPCVGLSGQRLHGEALRRRAAVAGRHLGGHDVGHRLDTRKTAAGRCDAQHLHHLDALQRHVRGDQVANRSNPGRGEVDPGQGAGKAARVIADENLPLMVVVAGNPVRGRQHLVHRRIEPLIDALANQLAPDDEDEQSRHHRHAEQERDELGPEPGKRQAPPPLDDQLDDVAREDEHQRREHRQVGDRQRIEDDLAEEVGGRPRRPVRHGEDHEEHRHEGGDSGEDQPRIVAKRTADRQPPRRWPLGPGRRDRRDGGWHINPWRSASP